MEDFNHINRALQTAFFQKLTRYDCTRFITPLPRSVTCTQSPGKTATDIPREILENLSGSVVCLCVKKLKVAQNIQGVR